MAYERDLREGRDILIYESIDEYTASSVTEQILTFLAEDEENVLIYKDHEPQPINLYINSPGGDIDSMWAIINLITSIDVPVYTYCYGMACSAAFMLLQAGDKRYISENATLMYHQMSIKNSGKLKDIEHFTQRCTEEQNKIDEFLLNRTGLSKYILDNVKSTQVDKYFSLDEIKEYDLADAIFLSKVKKKREIEHKPSVSSIDSHCYLTH